MESTDQELTHRLTWHDEAAFSMLFRRYYGYLYRVAVEYVKDPALAEDAVQDVYLKLWTHRQQLDPDQSVKAYLATALRHQVLNRLRDDKRAILRHIDRQTHLPDADTTTEDTILLNDYRAIAGQGLDQLSPQRRLVFTLRSEQGLTNEEVAIQLQLSINTVKVHYYHACRFLRGYLHQHADMSTLLLALAVGFLC